MNDWIQKDLKNYDILAVDDDSLILDVLEVSCRPFHQRVSVHTAPNVHAAIDMVRKQKFDLLCLDHDLDGVRGWELLDYLRPHLPKSVKVLVYSSMVDEISLQAYRQRAVVDILKKPLAPAALGFAIRKSLNI